MSKYADLEKLKAKRADAYEALLVAQLKETRARRTFYAAEAAERKAAAVWAAACDAVRAAHEAGEAARNAAKGDA